MGQATSMYFDRPQNLGVIVTVGLKIPNTVSEVKTCC